MLNKLRERSNNASRPSSRGGAKTKATKATKASTSAPTASTSNSASASAVEEATIELATLSTVLEACRGDTKVSLTKLARLAKSSGASDLALDIKAFAERKNSALDALDLEVTNLLESFEARFATTTTTAANNDVAIVPETIQQRQSQQQLLPDALSVNDMFEEGILRFLSMKDISKGVAYTCKRWNRAARSEPVWKYLVKRDFIKEVAPLCQVGIVLSNPTSPDQMTYLEFAENRFKADATVNKWLSNEMKEHPAIKKLLLYKPDEIGVLSWISNNDKVATGAECLSMLARGIIIPEFFHRYEKVALEAYKGRDKRAPDYDSGDPVELPDVPQGLSPRAVEHHRRARNAVARIYLRKNGELQTYKPRFSYYNDYALFLCSTGPLMSKGDVISSLSAFGEYYENETW